MLEEIMQLAGKVAIVTGASSGIGRAIALALAEAGAAVTVNYNSGKERAAEVERAITGSGGQAISVQGDVGKVAELENLVARTVERFGRLDIMVNNAGVGGGGSVLEASEEDYDRVLATNLKSAFFGTQLAAKQMLAQGGGGRIINISSIHEDWPMPGDTPYCCAKGGMRMLTRNAGVELAPHGITVVGVGPGAISTPINQETLNDPKLRKLLEDHIPAGRVGEAAEVAGLVVWLASAQSAYVTATTYFIDGGMMQYSVGL
jgi:glucose 1-dehydrogenase